MHSLIAASAAARLRPLHRTAVRTPFPSDASSLFTLVLRRRASSMSAIVRGLRRTFRDKGERKGQRAPGYDASVAARVAERRRMREAAPPQTFRLLRGKKDVTPEVIPEPKSRRARFFDPEDKFGKKSLVYQMKTGQLEKEVQELAKQVHQDGPEEQSRRDGRDDDGDRRDRGNRRDRSEREAPYERDGRRSSQQRTPRRRDGEERDDRRPAETRNERRSEPRGDRFQHSGSARRDDFEEYGGSQRFPSRRATVSASDVPLTIPFTTAASQFLYGRSVVEAALRSGRRRLYKLYVYDGANRGGGGFGGGGEGAERRSYGKQERQKEQQHAEALERIARRKGVQVQHVGDSWQRLLDKMSKGRPHNGFVLEASPLPQMPLVALGPWAADRGGFSVEAGHQSREEADVNGTADFVPVRTVRVGEAVEEEEEEEADPFARALTEEARQKEGVEAEEGPAEEGTKATTTAAAAPLYRPLVLMLDQVLDPGNLGGILRSASFLGVSAVVISKHSSAGLTPVALKAAAGAAETMTLFSTDAPAAFLAQSRAAGWKVYAAVPPEEEDAEPPRKRSPAAAAAAGPARRPLRSRPVLDLDDVEARDPLRREPCILVVGSEGEGLPRAIRREADVDVSIANRSGADVVDSLNVSVATGLLCASFLKGSARCVREEMRRQADEPTDDLGIW